MNYQNALFLFDDYIKRLNFALTTCKTYKRYIEEFFIYLNKNDIRDVEKRNMEEYLDYLLKYKKKDGNNLRHSTICGKVSALKRFFSFLLEEDHLLLDPCSGLDELKNVRRIRSNIFTFDEMIELLEQPDENSPIELRDKTILELFYGTGIRRSELINLKLKDINFDEGVIFIKGKGNKERLVPLGDKVMKLLRIYIKTSREELIQDYREEHLFITYKGKKMSGNSPENILKKYLKRCKFDKDICLHSIRHTFATHMLKRGADIRYIQAILGHESIGTTQIYLNLTVPGLREIYDSNHPIENELYFDVYQREKYIFEKKLPQQKYKGIKKILTKKE